MLDLVIVNIPYMFTNNPPVGGAVLRACVEKAGFTAEALDYNINFVNHKVATDDVVIWLQNEVSPPRVENYVAFKHWVKECAEDILKKNARWIGISVFTKDSQLAAEEFITALKDLDPNCKIVLGGTGQEDRRSQWGERWIDLVYNSGVIDASILKEGEVEIVKLLKGESTGLIDSTQLTVEQLNNVPTPNFDDYNLNLYGALDNFSITNTEGISIPITGSKGCVRKCTFCNVGAFWPSFRQRNGTAIGKEIVELYRKYGIDNFKFTDSLINGSLSHFRLCNEYITEHIPNTISYKGQFIFRPATQMPDRDYELMRTAGCKLVQIGVESGSERVREHMRKKFTNSDIERTSYSLAEQNISQQWFLFVGYPTETDSDFEETLALIEKYAHLAKRRLLSIIPTGVYLMLDNTPSSSPEMMSDMGLYIDESKAWQTYHWQSTKYTGNTFEVRANRLFRLVDLCRKLNLVTEFEDMIDHHVRLVKTELANA
jgi:radical SAM superfamily enzyme YgiQ (UPF0313 family)